MISGMQMNTWLKMSAGNPPTISSSENSRYQGTRRVTAGMIRASSTIVFNRDMLNFAIAHAAGTPSTSEPPVAPSDMVRLFTK